MLFLLQDIVQIMDQFPEVETCIEVSSTTPCFLFAPTSTALDIFYDIPSCLYFHFICDFYWIFIFSAPPEI